MKWFISKPPKLETRVTKKNSAVQKTTHPGSIKSTETNSTPSKSHGYDIDGFDR